MGKKKKKPTTPQPTPEVQPLVDPVPTSQVQVPVMSSITTVAPPITALSPPSLSSIRICAPHGRRGLLPDELRARHSGSGSNVLPNCLSCAVSCAASLHATI